MSFETTEKARKTICDVAMKSVLLSCLGKFQKHGRIDAAKNTFLRLQVEPCQFIDTRSRQLGELLAAQPNWQRLYRRLQRALDQSQSIEVAETVLFGSATNFLTLQSCGFVTPTQETTCV